MRENPSSCCPRLLHSLRLNTVERFVSAPVFLTFLLLLSFLSDQQWFVQSYVLLFVDVPPKRRRGLGSSQSVSFRASSPRGCRELRSCWRRWGCRYLMSIRVHRQVDESLQKQFRLMLCCDWQELQKAKQERERGGSSPYLKGVDSPRLHHLRGSDSPHSRLVHHVRGYNGCSVSLKFKKVWHLVFVFRHYEVKREKQSVSEM